MDNFSFFQERRAKTLEDLFFLARDKKLTEELRRIRKMKETKEALASVSGITNQDVLQKLIELNIRPEILASLAMAPLVEVAWADGKIDEKEKKAVLEAACKSFIPKDSVDFNLLRCWLEHKPDSKLLEAWVHYMKGLCEKLSDTEKDALKKDLIGHARAVAQAAGGFLGLGSKISKTEEQMLVQLEAVFN